MLLLKMYVTLFSSIFAGIVNSIFCKKEIFNKLKIPIDNNKILKDGKRIFGDNKTWKGFIGYIIFNIIFSCLFSFIWKILNFEKYNFFYINNKNTILFNLLIGFLIGLFYALFELPNSFIKRRLNISPGKNTSGLKKYFFIFLDQADSLFGICLVVWMFYPLGLKLYLLYILIGALTHLVINILLYLFHLRKNMF